MCDSGPDPEDYTLSNRATYDRIALHYEENQGRATQSSDHPLVDVRRSFVARLPERALVADLGCGPGIDAAAIRSDTRAVVGMDLSAAMLERAKHRIDSCVQGDLRRLPFRRAVFDGIWCCAALLHVPDSDTPIVLHEFHRVLHHGGALAIMTALGSGSRFEDVPYAAGERRWFVYREFDELRSQLDATGFKVHDAGRVNSNREWGVFVATSR